MMTSNSEECEIETIKVIEVPFSVMVKGEIIINYGTLGKLIYFFKNGIFKVIPGRRSSYQQSDVCLKDGKLISVTIQYNTNRLLESLQITIIDTEKLHTVSYRIVAIYDRSYKVVRFEEKVNSSPDGIEVFNTI